MPVAKASSMAPIGLTSNAIALNLLTLGLALLALGFALLTLGFALLTLGLATWGALLTFTFTSGALGASGAFSPTDLKPSVRSYYLFRGMYYHLS